MKAVRGWTGVLWIPMLFAAFGILLIGQGLSDSEEERAVRSAATSFLRDVQAMELPGQTAPPPPLDVDMRSVRITGDKALVRVTLRDGENTLRAEVRLARIDGLWRGRTIDFPDLVKVSQ